MGAPSGAAGVPPPTLVLARIGIRVVARECGGSEKAYRSTGKSMAGKLKIRRLGYALGAEVSGIDVAERLDDATIAEIRQAWLENIVLCFREQTAGPAELSAFSARFGELDDLRGTPQNRHPGHETVAALSNNPVNIQGTQTGGYPYGQNWHTDRQFTLHPATATFLLSKELPDIGGDTAFANLYLAYESLSPAMQSVIAPLEGIHDLTLSMNFSRKSPATQASQRALNPPVVHPVVRVHDETGRKALFVSEYVGGFVGMTPEESKPLLDFLIRHATRYENVYRHRWVLGDLLMWDNRCGIHQAIQDFDHSQMRRMIRCALLAPESGRYLHEAEQREAVAASS